MPGLTLEWLNQRREAKGQSVIYNLTAMVMEDWLEYEAWSDSADAATAASSKSPTSMLTLSMRDAISLGVLGGLVVGGILVFVGVRQAHRSKRALSLDWARSKKWTDKGKGHEWSASDKTMI